MISLSNMVAESSPLPRPAPTTTREPPGASSFRAVAVAASLPEHSIATSTVVSVLSAASAVITVACELLANWCPLGGGLHQQNTLGRFQMSQSTRQLADGAATGNQHRAPPDIACVLHRA